MHKEWQDGLKHGHGGSGQQEDAHRVQEGRVVAEGSDNGGGQGDEQRCEQDSLAGLAQPGPAEPQPDPDDDESRPACYHRLALTPSLLLLFVLQFCIGLGQGIGYPVLMGLSIQYVADAERTTAMGLHQAVYAIGMLGGPWLCGLLADAMGIRPTFGMTAFLAQNWIMM
ncbi:MAG: MFS transporter [Anaerolineae bacterium]|nr:MFS transporter [Anaerolineae bacterium]